MGFKIIEEKFIPFVYNKGYSFYLKERDLVKIKLLMSEYLAKLKGNVQQLIFSISQYFKKLMIFMNHLHYVL